jgi:16S rRNA (uracil1498-N3)-methyltransferase
MPLRRFFVPADAIRDGTAYLGPEQAHHLRHVLRLNAGQPVEIFDGQGHAWCGEIEVSGTDVRLVNLQPCGPAPDLNAPSLALAASIVKPERFEWTLQKATELGVDDIIPLHTRYSSIRIPESRQPSRVERWGRIAREAARQCGRNSVPTIHGITEFADFLNHNPLPGHARFLCYEKSGDPWHQGLLGPARVLLCIGPEGGWEEAEAQAAEQSGFRCFSLGPLVLRAETAALVAITLFRLRVSEPGVHV